MQKTNKKWALILVSMVLLVSASSCHKPDFTLGGPATITFAYPYSFRTDTTIYFEALVETFNQTYPDITINLQPVVQGLEYIRFDPGDADVLLASANSLNTLNQQQVLLDLNLLLEQDPNFDIADFHTGMIDQFQNEDRMWALPASAYISVLYYNRDLFDTYNVPYPEPDWTWEDFRATGLALSHPEEEQFGYAPLDIYFDALPFIYQHGGRIYNDQSQPIFDDPVNIEALEWYINLIYEDNIIPTPDQARSAFNSSSGYGYLAVTQDQAAMWIDSLAYRGGTEWPVSWDMNWGVAPLPRDVQSAAPTFLEGYAISADTRDPGACWVWITFLSEQMTTPFNATPARLSILQSDAYKELVGTETFDVTQETLPDMTFFSFDALNLADELDLFSSALYRSVQGFATPAGALVEAQQFAER